MAAVNNEFSDNDSTRVAKLNLPKATTDKTTNPEEHLDSKTDVVKPPDRKQALVEEPLIESNEIPTEKFEPERQLRHPRLS